MGVFYVADWKASITGITAFVTANDKMKDIFGDKELSLPVVKDSTYKAFYEAVFAKLGIACEVSAALNRTLPWAFVDSSNTELLQSLTESAFCICTMNRLGVASVKAINSGAAVSNNN